MRFRLSKNTRFSIAVSLLTAALTLSLFAGAAVGTAAQGGLAYDEVMKFVGGDQPTPQPGTFASDFQAAVDAQKAVANQPQHHGIFGGIQNMANLAKAGIATFKNGMPSTHYFLNNWERTDDSGKQTATILRPDRRQTIYLNLDKKTYRIVDMGTETVTATSPPVQGPPEQQPSPVPGTGKLDISVTSSVLGPKTIDNVATTGYSQDFKMTATQSTGSCHDGTIETSMIQYISNLTPPLARSNPSLKFRMSAPSPSMAAARPGCKLTTTMHHSGGATPPGDRLYLWMLMTLKGGTQTDQGHVGGAFSTLIERGNVRNLGPSDAALFDVPAGFTKEQ